jgi:hypothetical protein
MFSCETPAQGGFGEGAAISPASFEVEVRRDCRSAERVLGSNFFLGRTIRTF